MWPGKYCITREVFTHETERGVTQQTKILFMYETSCVLKDLYLCDDLKASEISEVWLTIIITDGFVLNHGLKPLYEVKY